LKKETIKELCAILLLVALLLGFAAVSSAALMPKRQNFGSTWERYLKEEQNSLDVLFFGSSISYCDVVPPVIWEKAEISTYVMAGPEQTLPITYFYVKEAIKTQHPKVIFVEVTGAFFEKYQSYTKVNIGYMPWDENRIGAIFNAAESAERTGLLFPLYNYHSRWDSLEGEDIEIAMKGYTADELAGYTFLDTAAEMTGIQPRNEVLDEENFAANIGYLKRIAELCAEKGILPVYYIAPTYWSLSEDHTALLKADIEEMDNVKFIDFNEGNGLSEYDPTLDFYDTLHFNYRGAEKFSANLAEILRNELKLSKSEGADKELWNLRAEKFYGLYGG